MDRNLFRRRILLLSIAAGLTGGTLLATENVEAYRRWRDRTAIDRMTGEHWGRYRNALGRHYQPPAPAYDPVSVEQPRRRMSYDYSTRTRHEGLLTEQNVYNFREQFNPRQSRQAMRSALGEPDQQYLDRDVWKVERIGLDGTPSGEFGTFEARYDGWEWHSKTTVPPEAHW